MYMLDKTLLIINKPFEAPKVDKVDAQRYCCKSTLVETQEANNVHLLTL